MSKPTIVLPHDETGAPEALPSHLGGNVIALARDVFPHDPSQFEPELNVERLATDLLRLSFLLDPKGSGSCFAGDAPFSGYPSNIEANASRHPGIEAQEAAQ